MRFMVEYGYDIDALARRKAELGLLDADLARKAGVTPRTVYNILTGQTSNARTIRKLAEAMGLNLADLVVRKEDAA